MQAARRWLLARYRGQYRHLYIYQLVPTAMRKRDAEDIIKMRLDDCHHQCELYDLPSTSTEQTKRMLDNVYGELEVSPSPR